MRTPSPPAGAGVAVYGSDALVTTAGREVSPHIHVRELLAHLKAPQRVVFRDLPKTSTGKVQKFQLREKEWAGHERRIQG